MADPAHTFAQPHEAGSRLHRLGLTPNVLQESVEVGVAGRRAATPFHPPSYPGYNQWAETHRALRERLTKIGWKADDAGGYSTVVSPNGSLAITVATGTERTGREGYPEPMTKYPRGPMTHAAVARNVQLSIPGLGVPADEEESRARRVTWFLLIHTRQDEVRMELSLPRSIGEDGRVDAWTERILLPAMDADLPLQDDPADDDPGPTGIIDVPVEPR